MLKDYDVELALSTVLYNVDELIKLLLGKYIKIYDNEYEKKFTWFSYQKEES